MTSHSGNETNMATNNTLPSPSIKMYGDVSEDVNAGAFIFLIVFTCIGNILLLIAIAGSHKLRHTANHFTLSLVLASFLMAATVMPLRVLSFINKELWINKPQLCEAYCTCFVLSCLVTVFSLVAMSLDRYFSISKTPAYRKFMSGNWRSLVVIASCWLAASILAVAPAKFPDMAMHIHNTYDCKLTRVYKPTYIYTFVSIEVLAPVTFMLLLHMRILKITVGHFRTVDIQDAKIKSLDSSDCPSFARETQWAQVAIKVSLSFIVFWFPRCVFLLVDNSQSESIHEVADGLTEILTYCFPASLPLLYATWSVEFRDVFVRMLCPVGVVRQRHDKEKYRLVTPNKVRPIGCSQYT